MILTSATIKGGCGKSTTAAALLQAAVHNEKRALAVDMDPQANLTLFLAADQNLPGAADLLHGAPAAELIQHSPQGIDVISGAPDLSAETTRTGSARRLERALQPVKDSYDIVIIDTPPNAGELVFNALQAADELLIPLEADITNLQGLYQIADIAHQMQRSNPNLRIVGTVITRYDGRARLNQYYRDAIREKSEEAGTELLAVIRSGVAVKESQGMQLSLFEYAPKSKPAADYMELYKKIMEA